MDSEQPAEYDKLFFDQLAGPAARAAAIVLPLLSEIYKPRSVLDVGCGSGDWLLEAQRLFDADILAIDGEWNEGLTSSGLPHLYADLENRLPIAKQFDLAICLEVAEHLTTVGSSNLLDSLTAASDVVLFSAAIPLQPGTNHINCHWQSHWIEEFAARSFEAFDVIRPQIWEIGAVEWWYKQNTFLMVKRDSSSIDQKRLRSMPKSFTPDLVHPDYYRWIVGRRTDRLDEALTDLHSAERRIALLEIHAPHDNQ